MVRHICMCLFIYRYMNGCVCCSVCRWIVNVMHVSVVIVYKNICYCVYWVTYHGGWVMLVYRECVYVKVRCCIQWPCIGVCHGCVNIMDIA